MKAPRALIVLTSLVANVALGAPVLADYNDIRLLGVREGELLFASGKQLGIATIRGEVLAAPQYSRLGLIPAKDGSRFAVRDGVQGFLTARGSFEPIPLLEQIAAASGETQYLPVHDAFKVAVNGRQGVVRRNGTWVLPPEFDRITAVEGSKKLFLTKTGEEGRGFFEDGKIQTNGAFRSPVDDSLVETWANADALAKVVTDYSGRPVSNYMFSQFFAQGSGFYYGVKSSRSAPSQPETAIYELRNGRLEVAFEARLPYGVYFPGFSEGLIFVCAPIGPPKSEDEYAAVRSMILVGGCGYVNRHGKPIQTPHLYRSGSRFVNGKAVACRVDLKARKHLCAWLRRDGSVIIEREFDGELWDGKANDQVAVILEQGNWVLFFPDGQRLDISVKRR